MFDRVPPLFSQAHSLPLIPSTIAIINPIAGTNASRPIHVLLKIDQIGPKKKAPQLKAFKPLEAKKVRLCRCHYRAHEARTESAVSPVA